MSFPRYPKYKDSGVEWLGQVPEHWSVAKCGRAISVLSGYAFPSAGFSDNDSFPRLLRGVNVGVGSLRWDEVVYWQRLPSDGLDVFELSEGDLVLGMDRPLISEGMRLARVHKTDLPCLLLQRVVAIRSRTETNLDYLQALLGSWMFVAHFSPDTTGVSVPHISPEQIKTFVIPFPPLPEQTAIAAFLDRETAKIDALVAEQHRLIELLKEKRQAVISHAVTKGLNPDAPMKDSGVEWVGAVPIHWECVRNKSVFFEVDERSVEDTGELLTVSHITGVTRRSEKEVNMILAETLEGYKKCVPGDLVINTMWAWMGALGCSPLEGLVSPSYNVYRRRNPGKLLPAYYDHLSRVPAHVVAMKSRSSGVWESRLRLYPDAFLDMRMPLPPTAEQEQIVTYLEDRLRKWDALIAEAQRAIELLQERRTALISAAVTGQIDVRDVERRAA